MLSALLFLGYRLVQQRREFGYGSGHNILEQFGLIYANATERKPFFSRLLQPCRIREKNRRPGDGHRIINQHQVRKRAARMVLHAVQDRQQS